MERRVSNSGSFNGKSEPTEIRSDLLIGAVCESDAAEGDRSLRDMAVCDLQRLRGGTEPRGFAKLTPH